MSRLAFGTECLAGRKSPPNNSVSDGHSRCPSAASDCSSVTVSPCCWARFSGRTAERLPPRASQPKKAEHRPQKSFLNAHAWRISAGFSRIPIWLFHQRSRLPPKNVPQQGPRGPEPRTPAPFPASGKHLVWGHPTSGMFHSLQFS